jgi:threonine dehydrogenase-like Zn-dependent dehydrogenase
MHETMRVLQVVEPGSARWETIPIPAPGTGEVLVRVESVTTCPHWDIHIMEGEPMFPERPLIYPYAPGQPGHEAMGTVAALGPDVYDFSIGDRVVAWKDAGHDRPGCYAQYVVMAVEHLLPLPQEVDPAAVTSLELAMCVQVSFDQLHALAAVEGKRFGVSGLGPAGLIAVQMARAYGASEVVGIDPLPHRRRLAEQLGADRVLAPDDPGLPPGRLAATSLDVAIDCTGLKGSIEYLMARTSEVVTIFGVLREDVAFGRPQQRGGFILMGYATHNRQAAERALQLVLDGKITLAPLATHCLPLTRYAEGIELLRQKEALKIRFDPWGL